MIISTQTDELSKRFGDEKAVRMIAEAGFDAVDYSMFSMPLEDPAYPLSMPDYERYAGSLRHVAEECGVRFNQAHAPFPSWRTTDEAYNIKIKPAISRAIEIAGILGADAIIVHPVGVRDNPEAQKQINMDIYHALAPTARAAGVRIALENMFAHDKQDSMRIVPNVCSNGAEFAEYIDALDDDTFTACLDIGHAGLVGENAAEMIRALGHDRLTAMHVHDNNFLADMHTLPFSQKVDWEGVVCALRDIKYAGAMTLESDMFLHRMPDDLLADAVAFMRKVAAYLASQACR